MGGRQTREALLTAGYATRSRALRLSFRQLLIGIGALLVLLTSALLLHFQGWLLVAIEFGVIGALVLTDRILDPRVERLFQGADGERTVGRELELLADDGWLTLHNVSLGRGDVDHVLIGPGGLFIIETKSHKGRFRVDRIDQGMLKQAYAEKKRMERITGYTFEPLLVFSNAWLIGRVPAKRDGVTILPARMLADFVSRRKRTVSPERAKQVHERLVEALAGVSV
jgi:hypothetical protein